MTIQPLRPSYQSEYHVSKIIRYMPLGRILHNSLPAISREAISFDIEGIVSSLMLTYFRRIFRYRSTSDLYLAIPEEYENNSNI